MEPKISIQTTKNSYPKNNKYVGKKIKIKKSKNLELNNPSINHFNYDSFFIFHQIDFIEYFNSLSNKNSIKLNFDEISFLKSISKSIELQKYINNNENFFSVDKTTFDKINSYVTIEKIKNPLVCYLEEIFKDDYSRLNLSCRKLSEKYFIDTGLKVGKSTINNILKKNLGLKYLKTTIKNKSLKSNQGIISCFCFIKILTRCLKLNFEPDFIDESKIELSNNHFKTWRFKFEEINCGNSSKAKSNLILAFGKNQVYHYEILQENCSSDTFFNFLENLEKKLENGENKKYLYILDNCTIHKTEKIISYLIKKKNNTIFTVPYKSIFNCVELSFRAIKQITYKNIYDNIESVNKDVINYLNSDGIKQTLLYNYCETINRYISYVEKNSDMNLNNFELNIKKK